MRILTPDVGGGFGAKIGAYPEEILLGVLSKKVGKPLRWLSLYYNYSENAQIPGTTVTLLPNGSLLPLNSGEGREAGVMLTLAEGRIIEHGPNGERNEVETTTVTWGAVLLGSRIERKVSGDCCCWSFVSQPVRLSTQPERK